jgi:hypothetical protein
MNALRPFARPVVLLWLCAFALFLAAPMEAFAKRDMVNGNDSLEGDPTDSVESGGSGGGVDLPLGAERLKEPMPRYYDIVVFFPAILTFVGTAYCLVIPNQLPESFEFCGGER